MVSKKAIIGIAVIVVIVVAVIAIAGSSSNDDSPEVRYDYDVTVADSFATDYGMIVIPDAGNAFVILDVTIANDSYEDGITTNPLTFMWDVSVNGITYSTDSNMFSHPGYQLIEIGQGATGTCTYVYQVPAGTTADQVTVSYEYAWTLDQPRLQHDDSLM